MPADSPTDEQYDEIKDEIDQFGNSSEASVELIIAAMDRFDKDEEIAVINGLRNQFNQEIDGKIAGRQASVDRATALKAKVDPINAAVDAAFVANPGDPTLQAEANKWGELAIQASNNLTLAKKALQDLKDIKTEVNRLVDQVIANIKGTVITLVDPDDPTNIQTFTEYTSEAYYTIV
ncbi:hypothetical protein [Singulisphaera sp. GP187]|uniref:hypothetical protein n=1 Tax=Singulisphaera sp. GP187 TaxID=1882752 RepID=UPI0020B105C7|nr:hypothetical protein [Singulisphaera sp. GP187]